METLPTDGPGAVLGRQVVSALGRPEGLRRVAVRRLWGNKYRVNVETGEDGASVRIADSFFVSADRDGNILRSTPPIARRY